MKKFYEKDSILKIFSLIIAIIIWLYITLVLDTPTVITIDDIPISYLQQNILTDHGLSVVSESTDTLEVKIEGSRKNLANINSENVIASVDLSAVNKAGEYSLPVTITIPYEYSEIIGRKPEMINVRIDKIIEERRNIYVKTVGNPEEGYIAGNSELETSSVLLKGAASVVSKISGVIATVDVTDRKTDLTDTVKIEFLDSTGKLIPPNDEIFDLISTDITEVQLTCPIMKLKTVPIKGNIEGILSKNLSYTLQPNTVTIYGYEEDIENIEAIWTEKFSIAGAKAGDNFVVKLNIPEKVFPRDSVSSVRVKINEKD